MTTKATNNITVTKTNTTTVAPKKPAPEYKLKGQLGWTLKDKKVFDASKLAVEIMGYRRQYRSQGIINFAKVWLEPTLNNIIEDLKSRGYTVAVQIAGQNSYGYANICIDVSKADVLGDTLFVAHYDTVDRDISAATSYKGRTWNNQTGKWETLAAPDISPDKQPLRKHVNIRDGIAYIDKTNALNAGVGCLGADDGAGLAVMLNLMYRGVIGGYCFTSGEECGGIGAGEVLKDAEQYLKQYKRSIEIDRRCCEEIVWCQGVGECASEEFTQWLCDELGMGHKPSDLGTYTDVATFAQVIPENVNIASGYINAHTPDEKVDLVYLDNLAEALFKADWSKAPEHRKANDFGKYAGYEFDDYYYDCYGTCGKPSSKTKKSVYKYGQSFEPLSETSKKMLMILMGQDDGFRDYVFSETIETEEEFEIVLENWYGKGSDCFVELIAEVL